MIERHHLVLLTIVNYSAILFGVAIYLTHLYPTHEIIKLTILMFGIPFICLTLTLTPFKFIIEPLMDKLLGKYYYD